MSRRRWMPRVVRTYGPRAPWPSGLGLGTMRVGETILPITRIGVVPGGVRVEGVARGPLPADRGAVILYAPDGREAICGEGWVDISATPEGRRLVVTYDLTVTVVAAR